MNETMTIRQVLEETVKILNGIQIPISMAEQIAGPLLGCVQNLNACIRAMEQKEKPQESPDGEPEAPDENEQ